MNEARIEGKLVRVPKLFKTKNGHAVCDFLLKVDRGVGEIYDNIPVTAWRDNAISVAGAFENQPVHVEGHIEVRKFEKDGKTEWRMSVVAEKLEILEASAFDEMADPNFPF